MTKFLFTIVMIALSFQIGFAQKILTSAVKMNVLYKNIDNPIKIWVSGYAGKDITLQCDSCIITKISNTEFNIRPQKASYMGIPLNVFINGKHIGSERYRVKSLPSETAFLDGIDDEGKIKRGKLSAQLGLNAHLVGFDICYTPKVSTYRVRIFKDGAKHFDKTFYDGPMFTTDLKQEFGKLNPGDEVLFSDMKIEFSNEKKPSLNPYIRLIIIE